MHLPDISQSMGLNMEKVQATFRAVWTNLTLVRNEPLLQDQPGGSKTNKTMNKSSWCNEVCAVCLFLPPSAAADGRQEPKRVENHMSP